MRKVEIVKLDWNLLLFMILLSRRYSLTNVDEDKKVWHPEFLKI